MNKYFLVIFKALIPSVLISTPCNAELDAKKIYSSNCMTCHGPSALGDGPAAKAMKDIKPRNLVSDKFKNGDSVGEISATIASGIPPLMPSWKSQLTPQEINALALHIKKLRAGKP